jgi:hypothetical protein
MTTSVGFTSLTYFMVCSKGLPARSVVFRSTPSSAAIFLAISR